MRDNSEQHPANTEAQVLYDGRKPKVAVVASLTSSLVNFRLDFLKELSARADVMACAPDAHPETEAALAELGIHFVQIPMARTGVNPVQDLATLRALYAAFHAFRPDIVFPYTMKPIIYGGLAARLARVPRRFALCTGLGYVFVDDGDSGLKKKLIRALSVQLYRRALKGAEEALVYNNADADEFRTNRLIGPQTRLDIVPGSGVNLDRYPPSDPPNGAPVFLMIGRLLRDKGVFEYVEAARLLRTQWPEARCQLLGPLDANPASVQPEDLKAWEAEGIIEYLGETSDVHPYLSACSVFVLPSYREGISRTVLEAMSTGRAIITSDAPGCAEPVEEGVTGFVTPVRNPQGLAGAMARFMENPSLVAQMGAAARRHAEGEFDVARINTILLNKLGLLQEGEVLSSA
ncbi:MAG: glycosyltransferase family 4 protein [Ruegeria sp.]|uniref:glycosyltransferase family 4 protein n=1 Tax=Ruegeria sp. TaxID=1879320 RepID=UPI00349EF28A